MSTIVRPTTRWQLRRRQSPELIKHLCKVRSIPSEELELDFDQHLHDPYLLPDMDIACQILVDAAKNRQSVAIFGDYDADGTPAAALLSIALTKIGVSNTVRLPNRTTGYGIRLADVEELAKVNSVLITVDTGITSIEEIALAKKLKMKVIILDHHLPKNELPPADALIDPFLPNSNYPFQHLCGCALAYKLVWALSRHFSKELSDSFRKWLLDLVAISTVADMMSMTGENRTLVHYGLKVLRKNRRIGLRELLKRAAINPAEITAGTIGFAIGPRLNAAGRIADNWDAFLLLTESDQARASQLATKIEEYNRTRQRLVEETLLAAQQELFIQNKPADYFYVIAGDNWPSGVLGLVAGRISAVHCRPVVVLSRSGKTYSGSGRSPQSFSLIDALNSAEKYLEKFGGHRLAAGLACSNDNLSKLSAHLKKYAGELLTIEDTFPVFQIDAELSQNELAINTAIEIEKLAPFGIDNPTPAFLIRQASLHQIKLIGRDKNHLKLTIKQGDKTLDAIGFGLAASSKNLNDGMTADLVGCLEVNRWNGRKSVQFKLLDFDLSGKDIEVID